MNGNRYREGEVGAGRPERRADEEQLADARVQRQPRQVLAERRERLACVRAQPQARARESGGRSQLFGIVVAPNSQGADT